MSKKLTATKVSQHLDISVQTLTTWYKWQNSEAGKSNLSAPKLPNYSQDNPRSPRYWLEEDLPQLRQFQDWIPKGRGGVMGSINSHFWGARGKKKST